MTPRRLAYLIGALFVLATATTIAIGRYPDQEAGLTVDRANALNEVARAGGSSYAECSRAAPDPDRPCTAVHLHNFAARARLLSAAVVVTVLLTSLGFRRRLDRPRWHGADPSGADAILARDPGA